MFQVERGPALFHKGSISVANNNEIDWAKRDFEEKRPAAGRGRPFSAKNYYVIVEGGPVRFENER